MVDNNIVESFIGAIKTDKRENNNKYSAVVSKIDREGNAWVRIAGSETETPTESTSSEIRQGDNVTVEWRNNKVYISGNYSNPSAGIKNVTKINHAVDIIDKQVGELTVETAKVKSLIAEKADIQELHATNAEVDNLKTSKADIQELNATNAEVDRLKTGKADVQELTATNAEVDILKAGKVDIDFANVTTEAVKNLFVNVGMIENAVIEEGRITGTLAGVTVVADRIEANSIVAGDLIVQDENNEGIYYKINPTESGLTVDELDALEYSKFVSGRYIVAKSITADQIAVTDLYAFGATIAGLQMESGKIYTAGKSTVSSNAPGIYMDSLGQFNTGDGSNFIASWYDTVEKKWKVAIQADQITLGSSGQTIENAISAGATLVYDHSYAKDPENSNLYTFTAHLWEGKNEVTKEYDPEYFVWYYKTDPDDEHPDGLVPINGAGNYGYTITVDVSDAGNAPIGFRGTVVGRFAPANNNPLIDHDDKELQTGDGDTITGRTSADGYVKVTELPIQTPILTDYFMGIGTEREYRATLQQLKNLIIADLDADKHYTHIQSTPSDKWEVAHNLDKRPSISVVDSAGTEVVGEYAYIDDNNVILRFSGAFAGKAYFN